jgi:hypothetical protein
LLLVQYGEHLKNYAASPIAGPVPRSMGGRGALTCRHRLQREGLQSKPLSTATTDARPVFQRFLPLILDREIATNLLFACGG